MPRPRSSTFYLPLAPADAPLSLKAKLSVLPPSAANALLAPRNPPATTPSTHTPVPPLDALSTTQSSTVPVLEDECARLERVLGLCNNTPFGNPSGSRRNTRRHTDAPLPQLYQTPGVNPFSLPLPKPDSHSLATTESVTDLADPRPTLVDPVLCFTFIIGNLVPVFIGSTLIGLRAESPMASVSFPYPLTTENGLSTMCDACVWTGLASTQPFATATRPCFSLRETLFGRNQYTSVETRKLTCIQSLASTSTLGTSAVVAAPAVAISTSGPSASSTSPRIGASEMDAFASACAFGAEDMAAAPVETPEEGEIQAVIETTITNLSAPSSLSRPTSATKPSRPATADRRRLSMVPCGLPKIWACRTLHPSKLCSSVSADETAAPVRRTVLVPNQLVLPSSIASCGSLHPSDTRHLLPRQFRMSFPPPPPPCPAATAAPEECAPCTDGINTGLTTAGLSTATFASTHSPADETAVSPGGGEVTTCTQMEVIVGDGTSDRVMPQALPPPPTQLDKSPVRITLTPPGPQSTSSAQPSSTPSTPPPRQRYRLAPLYLHKVLRRSLGATAWSRAETVRLARAVEQACGVALVSQASTVSSSSSTIGRHTQWDDIVRAGYHLPPVDTTSDLRSSLVWTALRFQANSAGGANVWIQNVFDSAECAWDIDLEDEEDDADMEMDFDNENFEAESTFVRESAPEPEERRPVVLEPTSPHTPVENNHEPPTRVPASNVGLRLAVTKPELEDTRSPSPDGYGGYAAVGKFTWDSEWPANPTIARPPTGIARQWSVDDKMSTWRMDEDGPPATPYHPVLSPSTCSSSSSASTSSGLLAPFSQDEEETFSDIHHFKRTTAIRRYQRKKRKCSDTRRLIQTKWRSTWILDPYLAFTSFPPPPLIGTKISSCGESEDESDSAVAQERGDEFYDVPSPTAGVFVIPPSPLTKTTFGQPSPLTTSFAYSSPTVGGASTPTSASRFAQQQQQPALVDDDPPRRSLERIRSSRRSMERIGPAKRSMEWIKPAGRSEYSHEPSSPTLVAPRPRRASRALENVFSRQSPVFKTSALPNSPTSTLPSSLLVSPPSSALLLPTSPPSSNSHLPTSPPLSASSPPLSPPMTKAGVAAWTFGSLKSALSNSVTHLVELARSRSPSPLPWLIRGSGIAASSATSSATTSTPLTLSGAAAALAQATTPVARPVEEGQESSTHTRDPSSEELEAERSSCVTPTPTSSRPRRASSTTITKVDAVAAVIPVPQVQLETTAGEVVVGTSPPPKRTLSTSSLSSLESEPESESGSSGGVFSRSPSPEPDSRAWDASSLTPRSRPISADAKGAASNSGRLSPMMIPGSWDPNELLWDDEDVANDQLRI
ncbi:SubName: Full=Uncharacterized protein {ECO:0000313/EMBL:CCA77713.1} [Serendipita indica DSM 11827]|nr:SubName: Full=Uncharacterized protein {ECO:0000313/EMBL:CCA77713.1} [Serendipita indica DSM 11827]